MPGHISGKRSTKLLFHIVPSLYVRWFHGAESTFFVPFFCVCACTRKLYVIAVVFRSFLSSSTAQGYSNECYSAFSFKFRIAFFPSLQSVTFGPCCFISASSCNELDIFFIIYI